MIASRPSNHPLGRQKSHQGAYHGPQCVPELQGSQKRKHTACIDASATQIPPSSTQPRACGQKYTRIPLPRVARCAGCGFHRNTMQLHGSICGHGPKTSRKPACVNKYVKGAWVWWTCPEAYQRKEPCLEHRRTADSRKDLLTEDNRVNVILTLR